MIELIPAIDIIYKDGTIKNIGASKNAEQAFSAKQLSSHFLFY